MSDDDATTPLPDELSRFFSWGTEDEPAPYAPPRDTPQEALAFLDIVREPDAAPRQVYRWRPAAAAIAGVAGVVALAVWGLGGDEESATTATPSTPATATAPEPVTTAPEPVAIDTRLAAVIPPGYGPGACRPLQSAPRVASLAACGPNSSAPGTTARYTLFSDAQSLNVALNEMINTTAIEVCPGNYMSPGAWRRKIAPDVAAGTLVCGTRDGEPAIGWTLDDARMLAVITATPTGQTNLADLYTWWSTHS